MTQAEKTTDALPCDDDGVADDGTTKLVQALADKKAAIAKTRHQPPFPKPRAVNKGKKIGNSPRGTRKSMGKR